MSDIIDDLLRLSEDPQIPTRGAGAGDPWSA